jgi:hypothetical protein
MAFSSPPPSAQNGRAPGFGVTAVLGPTNTGKTHLAIERMVAHSSGVIGLPLRLLAREVYNKIVDRVGVDAVALITGEEKIKPAKARYWVSTVEAMPRDLDVSFLAVAATRRCCSAPPPCGRSSSGCCPAPASSPGRGCRSWNSPAIARSPGSRGAPPLWRFPPTRFTPSPN